MGPKMFLFMASLALSAHVISAQAQCRKYQCGGCEVPYPCTNYAGYEYYDSLTATSCWEGCMGTAEWRTKNNETCTTRANNCCRGPEKFKCGGCVTPYPCDPMNVSTNAKTCWEGCLGTPEWRQANNETCLSRMNKGRCCNGPNPGSAIYSK
ncbi:hypothetical protein DdX_16730 [Ditylenchus destructor]|uniref:Uncharacterized protein n=1 Tax=Ditylenchus destructor TaxID=166010 RepID=A0AAD4MMK7_9BILA|nr:hypothetical protein DdX_16730 [Ditylenchus destructor]